MKHPWNSLCPACKGYPGQQHTQDAFCLEYQEAQIDNPGRTSLPEVPSPSKEKSQSDVFNHSERSL